MIIAVTLPYHAGPRSPFVSMHPWLFLLFLMAVPLACVIVISLFCSGLGILGLILEKLVGPKEKADEKSPDDKGKSSN